MATPVVVNGDTSLVLINTKSLTANQAAVVLLSSIQEPGRLVTVRDSVGFLSTPQRIIVSTMGPAVRFADGTSSVTINQPYGSLTLTSRDQNSWNFVNSFGFPQNQTIANVAALTVSTIATSNLYATGFVSTPYMTLNGLLATSTCAVYGPTYTSTLVVGPPPSVAQPPLTDPGYAAYVQGSVKIQNNLDVDGAGFYRGQISTGSNVFVAGNISTLGSFGVRGDIQTLGNITAPRGNVIASNLDIRGNATVGGIATFSNTLNIGSNLFVQGTISSLAHTTSSLTVASTISFQEKYIAWRPTDLLFSHAINAPSFSTLNLVASNSIQTSNLTVFNSIQASQVSSLVFGSANIINPFGTMTISTLLANSATFSNEISTLQLQTSSMRGSTIVLTGDIVATNGGYLNINTMIASTISTGALYANTVGATLFTTNTLNISTLTINSQFIANNLSSFQASNVAINNTDGTLTTGALFVQTLTATSSITTTAGLISTTNASGILRLLASNVVMNAANISTVTTSTLAASSITATQIIVGAPPPAPTPLGPTFAVETALYPSTNVTITGGPGDYVTPWTVSSTPPPGVGPGVPWTVDASFGLNFNGPTLPGYYAYILGLNLVPNGELASQITVRAYNDSNTIASLNGLSGSNQSYATPSNVGGIAVPADPLPSSFIHVTGTMYGASAFTLQFLSRSNDNYSAIDSNNTVTFNNGAIRWPYYLNGTTIQNALNDMTLRSLYYYGGLNFTSDPALKENVAFADLERCTEIVRALPLKRYKYIDSYLSTFRQTDAHRLGFLATDLEPVFPKSVAYTQLPELAGAPSTVRMIDTQQLEMAHIGATQALIRRVEVLQQQLSSLSGAT